MSWAKKLKVKKAVKAVKNLDPARRRRDVRLLLACMPKSGSTFLSAVLAEMPGMRRVNLVPGHMRREQEICLSRLADINKETQIMRDLWRRKELVEQRVRPAGFVTQMHVRYSGPTAEIIEQHNLQPVVLVRNLFDTVVSIRDHYRKQAVFMPMAYVDDDMKGWPDERLHEFIADMVMPWYINFYMCWNECPENKFVTYEDMVNDVEGTVADIAKYVDLPRRRGDIQNAIEKASSGNTRKNKAVTGRGETLDGAVIDRIRRLASYYPQVDFSPVGL